MAKWRAGDADDDDDDGGVVGNVGVHASGCAARCVPGLISRPPRYQKEKKKSSTIAHYTEIHDNCVFSPVQKLRSFTIIYLQ